MLKNANLGVLPKKDPFIQKSIINKIRIKIKLWKTIGIYYFISISSAVHFPSRVWLYNFPNPLQGRSATGFLTSGFIPRRYQRRILTRETDCSKSGKITFCLFASVWQFVFYSMLSDFRVVPFDSMLSDFMSHRRCVVRCLWCASLITARPSPLSIQTVPCWIPLPLPNNPPAIAKTSAVPENLERLGNMGCLPRGCFEQKYG